MIPTTDGFWNAVDRLVAESTIRIDRPKGTTHPRYPSFYYPLDYGYLEDTQAADGGGIDVWKGSLPTATVTAVVCTVDMVKRDSEIKLLIGCTHEEALTILGHAQHRASIGNSYGEATIMAAIPLLSLPPQ